MASKEWSSAVEQVTALTPRSAIDPSPCWQGVVSQKLNDVHQLLQDSFRHPLSAASLRKHAKDRDREQTDWNDFIKALQENKMPKMQHLDLGVKLYEFFRRPRISYTSMSLMASSFRNVP